MPVFESSLDMAGAACAREQRAHAGVDRPPRRVARAHGRRIGQGRAALRPARPTAAARAPRAAARRRGSLPRTLGVRGLPARSTRSGQIDAGRRPARRHRRGERRALRGGGGRFRHRGGRAATDGAREVPARPATVAREPAAVRAPGRIGRRQPAALPRRRLHQRRLALRAARPALRRRRSGAHHRARQRDRGRRLHARDVRLRRHGARSGACLPRGSAPAQGCDRRDRDRGRTRRRARCTPPCPGSRTTSPKTMPTRSARCASTCCGWPGIGTRAPLPAAPAPRFAGRRPARHHAGRWPQAGRHARDHRAPLRRLGLHGVPADLRARHGLRARVDRRFPGRPPDQQRSARPGGCQQGDALHPAVLPVRAAAGLPAEHHGLHRRPRIRACRHDQARLEDDPGRGQRDGAASHDPVRRVLRRRQLRHVRARLRAALPVLVAQRAHRRHGCRAGRRHDGDRDGSVGEGARTRTRPRADRRHAREDRRRRSSARPRRSIRRAACSTTASSIRAIRAACSRRCCTCSGAPTRSRCARSLSALPAPDLPRPPCCSRTSTPNSAARSSASAAKN